MRNLQYKESYKLQHSLIEKGIYLYENKPLYFEKVSTVFTKYGIAVIYECDWATNSLPVKMMVFKTVLGGKVYSAELNEQRLSERQLKWLATNFMKTIYSNQTK